MLYETLITGSRNLALATLVILCGCPANEGASAGSTSTGGKFELRSEGADPAATDTMETVPDAGMAEVPPASCEVSCPAGIAGKDGKDGANGFDGAEGPMGPQGPQGVPGLQGPAGNSGIAASQFYMKTQIFTRPAGGSSADPLKGGAGCDTDDVYFYDSKDFAISGGCTVFDGNVHPDTRNNADNSGAMVYSTNSNNKDLRLVESAPWVTSNHIQGWTCQVVGGDQDLLLKVFVMCLDVDNNHVN